GIADLEATGQGGAAHVGPLEAGAVHRGERHRADVVILGALEGDRMIHERQVGETVLRVYQGHDLEIGETGRRGDDPSVPGDGRPEDAGPQGLDSGLYRRSGPAQRPESSDLMASLEQRGEWAQHGRSSCKGAMGRNCGSRTGTDRWQGARVRPWPMWNLRG